jgi:hypothetical protein
MKEIIGVSRHARLRAIERIGFDPSRDDWLAAVLACIDQTAMLVTRNGNRELRIVRLGDVHARVWWDPDAAVITTLVPLAGPVAPPELRRLHEQQAHLRQRRRTEPYRRARKDWSADA